MARAAGHYLNSFEMQRVSESRQPLAAPGQQSHGNLTGFRRSPALTFRKCAVRDNPEPLGVFSGGAPHSRCGVWASS